MRKLLLIIASFIPLSYACSQGMSFSYLIPKNGYLSAPVSPFSIRGLGIGDAFGVETGGSIYNVPGLAMENLPFNYKKPLVGPLFALFVPVELFVKIPLKKASIKFMAGGFIWWNINPRINEGNMDRAFRAYEGWDVLNTDFKFSDKLGKGFLGGIEFEFPVSKRFSIITEAQYLIGSSESSLQGSYTGGNASGLQTKEVKIEDASTEIAGLEISLGVVFNQ